MPKFRKKSIVIEAYQFSNRIGTDTRPAWIIEARDAGKVKVTQPREAPAFMEIQTLEGVMRAEVDDWIIKGVKGEIYPCKPDIFAATYDAADDACEPA